MSSKHELFVKNTSRKKRLKTSNDTNNYGSVLRSMKNLITCFNLEYFALLIFCYPSVGVLSDVGIKFVQLTHSVKTF